MHPIVISLGGVDIYGYGVFGALAFVVASGLVLLRARAQGLSYERVADVIFWSSVAAIAGARGLYVALNAEQFGGWQDWINLRTGGLVFYGALLTGLPVGLGLVRRYGLPILATFDIFATAMPLGHAISRIGCFFAGCCYGRPTDVSWAVTFTDPLSAAPRGIPLHPTQLYESFGLFVIAAVLNAIYPRRRFDGEIIGGYLFLYGLLRPLIETLRDDPTRGFFLEGQLGPLISTSQAISALVISVGLGLLAWSRQNRRTLYDANPA